MDVDPGSRETDLSGIGHNGAGTPLDRIRNVGIVKDNRGRFPAQLQRDSLEITAGSEFQDLLSRVDGTGEADFTDSHVRRQNGTRRPVAREDLEDTRRETGLLDQLTERKRRKGSLLRGLDDEAITRSQGRGGFHPNRRTRGVPRAYPRRDAEGLVSDNLQRPVFLRERLAREFIRPPCKVVEAVGAQRDLKLPERSIGGAQRQPAQVRQSLAVFPHQLGELDQDPLPLAGQDFLPPWECLLGGEDGGIDVLSVGDGDFVRDD